MAFEVQIRDNQTNALLARSSFVSLPQTTFSIGSIQVARINGQVTPYTGQGDSGSLTSYTITPLSNEYPLMAASWSHTDEVWDSTGGGGTSSATEALSPSDNYAFYDDDYHWQNTTLQQWGFRTTATTLIVLNVAVPSPVTITVTTAPDPAAGGTTSPERRVIQVLPGKQWSVLLTATLNLGYVFNGWYLNSALVSSSLTYTYQGTAGSVNETYHFEAVFSVRTSPTPPAPDAPFDPDGPDPTDPDEGPKYSYIVVYTRSDPDGVATTTPNGITYVGYPTASKLVTCTAVRNSPAGDGYEFVKWMGTAQIGSQTRYADGSGGAMRAMLTFPPRAGEVLVVTFTAHYKELGKFKVTTAADPVNCGATTGDGMYALNEICTVGATPAAGCKFLKWKDENGNVVSRNAVYSFAVTQDVDLTALFHRWTLLILHSPTNNRILHGSENTILHDGDP